MKSELQTLVALDGEVDRGLIETLVTRDPRVTVLDYLELGGPSASGLGSGDALIVAVADYTAQVRDFIATAIRQHPLASDCAGLPHQRQRPPGRGLRERRG